MRHSAAMVALAPSLLSSDFSCFGATVASFERARGAERPDLLHFDLMDGHFVPNLTFGTGLLRALRGLTTIPFDVHLMVENGENYIASCRAGGAQRVAVHCEATRHLPRLLTQIRDNGMQAGVAINPATPLESIRWVAGMMDYLLIMGVNPGFSGQGFIASTVDKLRNARALLDERCSIERCSGERCSIGIDGGVSSANAAELCRAGAEMLVAGSSLFAKTGQTETGQKAKKQENSEQENSERENSEQDSPQFLARLRCLRAAASKATMA